MSQLERDLRDLFEAEARSVKLLRVRRLGPRGGRALLFLAAAVMLALAVVVGNQLARLRDVDSHPAQRGQPILLSERPACAVAATRQQVVASFEIGDGVAKICRPQLSADRGANWTDLDVDWLGGRGPADESVLSIGVEPGSGHVYLGTSYGRILRASAPFTRWDVVRDPGPDAFQPAVQGFAFDGRVFAASRGLLLSADGRSWTDITSGLGSFDGPGTRGRTGAVGPTVADRRVLIGISGNRPEVGVWATVDEGRTWVRALAEGEPLSLSSAGNVVAVAVQRRADGPTAWISRDAGRTWVAADYQTARSQFGAVIRAITVTSRGVFAGSAEGLLALGPNDRWFVRFEGSRDVRRIYETPEGLLLASASGLWFFPDIP